MNTSSKRIKVAIAEVGNCAQALLEGKAPSANSSKENS